MSDFEVAATNYRPLRYSNIKIAPGADYVLTADPCSFLHSQLLMEASSQRGKNRSNTERAVFYLGLAQNFIRASEASDLPAKATLLHYGMLNLVKVWLSVSGVELEKSIEHNGLSLPLGTKHKVKVGRPPVGSVSIFAEFAKALGTPVIGDETLSLEDVICRVPELHSTRKSMSPTKKEQF